MRTITIGEHNSHDNALSVSELTELLNNRDLPKAFPTYSNLGESPTEKIVTDFGALSDLGEFRLKWESTVGPAVRCDFVNRFIENIGKSTGAQCGDLSKN